MGNNIPPHPLSVWGVTPVPFRAAATSALALAVILAAMAILKFLSLHSAHADLGFMMNNMDRISAGEGWRLFWGHAQPLMYPYALVYGAAPEIMAAPLLLALQAAALGGALFGVLRGWGWLPGLAFALYFPVWYNALFDFHLDHLAIPLLVVFFLAAERDRMAWAIAAAGLLALVKEPFALQTVACGLYLVLAKRRVAAGVLLVAGGALYFLAVAWFLIPYFTVTGGGVIDNTAYSWLGGSLGEMILTLLSNPGLVWQHVVIPGKIFYVVGLLGGLAFLSLGAPWPLLVAAPIVVISLLSDNPGYFGLKHHYTAGLIAPLIFAFALTMRRMAAWRDGAMWRMIPIVVLVLAVGHVAYAPSPVSRLFWTEKVWSYGRDAYRVRDRDMWISEAIDTYIPTDPSIAVSAQNTLNTARLAHRKYYYIFPDGVLRDANVPDGRAFSAKGLAIFLLTGKKARSEPGETRAEFVVLDLKRPWYLVDKGCRWLYGQCRDATMAAKFQAAVAATRRAYIPVFSRDGFSILKRAPTVETPGRKRGHAE